MRTDDAKRIDEEFRIALNDFGAHISSLRSGVPAGVNERVELWDIRAKLTSIFDELIDRHEKLCVDFVEVVKMRDAMSCECSDVSSDNLRLHKENESLRKRLHDLCEDFASLSAENDKLGEKASSVSADNIILRKENKALRRKNREA
ncbi:MAG: hypothetical protein AB7F40_04510 [Victivallaceae bacterium]